MKLTATEKQIIELLIKEKTNQQIAEIINKNPKAVYEAIGKARRKTGSLTDRMMILRFKEIK